MIRMVVDRLRNRVSEIEPSMIKFGCMLNDIIEYLSNINKLDV